MKEHLKWRIPLKVPSWGKSHRSSKAKGPRKRVVFPTGIGRRSLEKEVLEGILALKKKAKRRLEETWRAFVAAFAVILPGCVKGISLDSTRKRSTANGITRFYKWILKTWLFQGETWVLERISNLCDWALYYSTESSYSPPELKSGLIGGTRDQYLKFPWLRGELSWICPTVGPYASNPEGTKTAFGLYTIYSVKGALPGPTREKIISSLKTHRSTLSSGKETPAVVVEAAERWAKAYRKRIPPDPKSVHVTISGSAICEATRKLGGRSQWIRDLLEDLKKRPSPLVSGPPGSGVYLIDGFYLGVIPPSGTLEVNYENFFAEEIVDPSFGEFTLDTSKVWTRVLTYHLFGELWEGGWVPTPQGEVFGRHYSGFYLGCPPKIITDGFKPKPYAVNAQVVEEQGAKARVITLSPGAIATLLHLLRTYCFSSLRKDPEVGTLAGEGTLVDWMRKINKYLSENPSADISDEEILSLDLTRATDTFHQDVCAGFAKGFLEDPRTPPLVRALYPIATAGVSIVYPSWSKVEALPESNRGILMGNPSSWFFLNLFTRFHWELSGFLKRKLGSQGNVFKRNGEYREKALREIKSFPEGVPLADPKTNRCGDDQISLTKLQRALIFESSLVNSGAIISAGVHFRSRSYGIYTKQLCVLNRETRRVDYVDILRARTLSTPDTRLPGRKENPPEWSRGSVAFKETEWWTGGEWQDSIYRSACTFLHWRYSDFLKRVRTLGGEIYLPIGFGGLQYPHYKREVKLSNPTRRMISSLTRDDVSLKHLLASVGLGKLFMANTYSELGKKVRGHLEAILEEIKSDGLVFPSKSFVTADRPFPKFGDIRAMKSFCASISESETYLKPLPGAIDEIEAGLYEYYSYRCQPAEIQSAPSLRRVIKRFCKIREEILQQDTHEYAPLRLQSFSQLLKVKEFRMMGLMVSTFNLRMRILQHLEGASPPVGPSWIDEIDY